MANLQNIWAYDDDADDDDVEEQLGPPEEELFLTHKSRPSCTERNTGKP